MNNEEMNGNYYNAEIPFGQNDQSKSYNGKNPKDMTIWELLNIPISLAVPELIQRGVKITTKLGMTAFELYKTISDDDYKEICRPIVTLDWCLRWFKDNVESYPETAYFFIVVEKNPKPRNENDNYSVTLALVDAEKNPILVKGSLDGYGYQKEPELPSIVAVAVPTRTIDKKLITALNSEKSVLIKK